MLLDIELYLCVIDSVTACNIRVVSDFQTNFSHYIIIYNIEYTYQFINM